MRLPWNRRNLFHCDLIQRGPEIVARRPNTISKALRIEEGDPSPAKFRMVEEMIRKVHAKGGACHIWLWNSGDGEEAVPGGPMREVDQRLLRYIATRLGPLPGWTMGYGFDTENGWESVEELDRSISSPTNIKNSFFTLHNIYYTTNITMMLEEILIITV